MSLVREAGNLTAGGEESPEGAEGWPARVEDVAERQALDDFVARFGLPELAPLVFLIPAYNEAGNVSRVIGEIPSEMSGMAVDVVVVTDGCNDGTADEARSAGAYVCEVKVNRGQGAAYRTGYRILAELGARYVVTLDADGQYNAGDVPALLQPILDGEADFAQGSRVIGEAERDDTFRKVGVRVFGALITLLLLRRVTDSSNGLRVMRIQVPATVRLEQDQYQASEMLIGAVRCGFRYVERPVRVRRRFSGNSKKAHNVFYGLYYLRAVLRTRFRLSCRNPEPLRCACDSGRSGTGGSSGSTTA